MPQAKRNAWFVALVRVLVALVRVPTNRNALVRVLTNQR
jgi:hypothetical protein